MAVNKEKIQRGSRNSAAQIPLYAMVKQTESRVLGPNAVLPENMIVAVRRPKFLCTGPFPSRATKIMCAPFRRITQEYLSSRVHAVVSHFMAKSLDLMNLRDFHRDWQIAKLEPRRSIKRHCPKESLPVR